MTRLPNARIVQLIKGHRFSLCSSFIFYLFRELIVENKIKKGAYSFSLHERAAFRSSLISSLLPSSISRHI